MSRTLIARVRWAAGTAGAFPNRYPIIARKNIAGNKELKIFSVFSSFFRTFI